MNVHVVRFLLIGFLSAFVANCAVLVDDTVVIDGPSYGSSFDSQQKLYVGSSDLASFDVSGVCKNMGPATISLYINDSEAATSTATCTQDEWSSTLDLSAYADGTIKISVASVAPFTKNSISIVKDSIAPVMTTFDDGVVGSPSSSHDFSWAAGTDADSGISGYQISVGSTSGAEDILSWADVEVLTQTSLALSTSPGDVYYGSIRALDKAGNVSNTVNANGWFQPETTLVSWWDGDLLDSNTITDAYGENSATSSSVTQAAGQIGQALSLTGWQSLATISSSDSLSSSSGFSVVAWVKGNPETLRSYSQTILSKSSSKSTAITLADWKHFDASNVDGSGSMNGFNGAVFDGRYIYYAPYHDATDYYGRVLRYDTYGDFETGSNWTYYDASNTDGANGNRGFRGSVFDGRYVYFVPYANGGLHGNVLRYDTEAAFDDAGSWSSYNARNTNGSFTNVGHEGAVFDGQYVYFVPGYYGDVLRYDTNAAFGDAGSWTSYNARNTNGSNTNKDYVGAVIAGNYLYFVPSGGAAFHAHVLRYDLDGDFTDSGSWTSYDASNTNGTNSSIGYRGGSFDGRYLYLSPYTRTGNVRHGDFLRYDTTQDFSSAASWTYFDSSNLGGANETRGFSSGYFDGRYFYALPAGWGSDLNMNLVRYDTTDTFDDSGSWHYFDASTVAAGASKGYSTAVSDGINIYLAPYYDGTAQHGNTIVYTPSSADSVFRLSASTVSNNSRAYCMSGPSFYVRTSDGVFSIVSKTTLDDSWHMVAATYDGTDLKLYVDNANVATRTISGTITFTSKDLIIGASEAGANASFDGEIDETQFYNSALTEAQILAIYAGSTR